MHCYVLFICHKSILDGDKYTKIGIGVIIQILEGLHALCYRFGIILSSPWGLGTRELGLDNFMLFRKGRELSWFCPSVFCYLIAVCPSVWILEIQKTSIRLPLLACKNLLLELLTKIKSWGIVFRRERLCLQYQMVQEQKLRTRSNDTIYQVNLLLELMQVG